MKWKPLGFFFAMFDKIEDGGLHCILPPRRKQQILNLLAHLMEPLVQWLGNKKAYNKEAEDRVGFKIAPFKEDSKKANHSQYKAVFKSWHDKINLVLMQCLNSTSKFEQRAGLNVLLKIVPFYPSYLSSYDSFVARLAELAKKENDGPPSDINVVALNLKAQLERRRKDMVDDGKSVKDDSDKKQPRRPHRLRRPRRQAKRQSRSVRARRQGICFILIKEGNTGDSKAPKAPSSDSRSASESTGNKSGSGGAGSRRSASPPKSMPRARSNNAVDSSGGKDDHRGSDALPDSKRSRGGKGDSRDSMISPGRDDGRESRGGGRGGGPVGNGSRESRKRDRPMDGPSATREDLACMPTAMVLAAILALLAAMVLAAMVLAAMVLAAMVLAAMVLAAMVLAAMVLAAMAANGPPD